MIDIRVIRGEGDNEGPAIIDPYLTTANAAIARGQHEIDNASDMNVVQMTTKFRPGVDVGQIVEVHDALQGRTWIGKIVGMAIRTRLAEVSMDVTIKRPRNY